MGGEARLAAGWLVVGCVSDECARVPLRAGCTWLASPFAAALALLPVGRRHTRRNSCRNGLVRVVFQDAESKLFETENITVETVVEAVEVPHQNARCARCAHHVPCSSINNSARGTPSDYSLKQSSTMETYFESTRTTTPTHSSIRYSTKVLYSCSMQHARAQ
jgi:hypothetical protein